MTATETKPVAAPESAVEQQRPVANRTYMPRADIVETKDAVVLVADVPGVDEKSLDITLEKSVLTIRGVVEPVVPAGFTAAYAEYGEGNYERSFKLSDDVDHDGIQASVKNGVLRLTLPKAGPAHTRKIEVKS